MKQKLRTKRNPELHGRRIRIGIVADLPNRRYFFDGGWPSGRRMALDPSIRGGECISRSRLIHARGDAVGRWKFQSAISIVTRGDRGAPPRGFQFHANRRRASLRETGAKHIPRPVHACLLLKCLHRPFRFPKYTGYCGFFEHRSSKRENFLSPNIFFLPFPFIQYRLWKSSSIFRLFLSKKGERVRAQTFLPCPRDLFFVTRESRDDSEMHRLCKYSGCWKKVIRDS